MNNLLALSQLELTTIEGGSMIHDAGVAYGHILRDQFDFVMGFLGY